MIALFFLAVLIFYIIVAIFCTVFVARTFSDVPKTKAVLVIVTALIFLLIPIWDVVPGQLYFHHLCETEGGLKIYKTAEDVDGFYQTEGGAGVAQSTLKYGYKFIEGTSPVGDFARYTLGPGGRLLQENITKPTSKYVVTRTTESRSFNVSKISYRISGISGEQYAVMSSISHAGNWLQVKFKPLLGHGGDCPSPASTFRDFYTKTLRPKN